MIVKANDHAANKFGLFDQRHLGCGLPLSGAVGFSGINPVKIEARAQSGSIHTHLMLSGLEFPIANRGLQPAQHIVHLDGHVRFGSRFKPNHGLRIEGIWRVAEQPKIRNGLRIRILYLGRDDSFK